MKSITKQFKSRITIKVAFKLLALSQWIKEKWMEYRHAKHRTLLFYYSLFLHLVSVSIFASSLDVQQQQSTYHFNVYDEFI